MPAGHFPFGIPAVKSRPARSPGAGVAPPPHEPYPRRSGTCAVGPSPAMPRARNEVFALIDDYIRWYNHERIKRSLGWMSPVQCRQSQGMAA